MIDCYAQLVLIDKKNIYSVPDDLKQEVLDKVKEIEKLNKKMDLEEILDPSNPFA